MPTYGGQVLTGPAQVHPAVLVVPHKVGQTQLAITEKEVIPIGGRGSQGGTRSTYRGNSTELFRQRQAQNQGSSSNQGGGGSSSSNGNGTASANTGGVQQGSGGGNGSGGGSNTTINQQPLPEWFDNLLKSDEDWTKGEDLKKAVEGINRKYSLKDLVQRWKYRNNCQRCAATVEMNARGYKQVAVGLDEGWKSVPSLNHMDGSASIYDIANMWRDENNRPGKWKRFTEQGSKSRLQAIKRLEDEVLSWPNGARGFIYVIWMKSQGSSAHIFNVENRNGKVLYIDAQPNIVDPGGSSWKTGFAPSRYNGVMRVDNLKPTDKVGTWMRDATVEEVNAPTVVELRDEITRRGWTGTSPENIALRQAFGYGWEQVAQGLTPAPTPDIQAVPEMLEAFNQGVTWARRPA